MKHELRTLVAVALAATTLACDATSGEAMVEGRITDQNGSQMARLGGSGTASAAVMVEAATVAGDGSITVVGEADVSADGTYRMAVPPNEEGMVLMALDSSGEVVASTILEASKGGETTPATPMDSESSLEAEVFLMMKANGDSDANFVDLRSRIDADTAVAVRGEADAQLDATISAIAEAISCAQETEVEAYAEAGVQVTQDALLDAEIEASQRLSAALHAGDDSAAAYESFLASLDAAVEAEGASAQDRSQAEASASVALRLTLDGRLGAGSTTDAAAVAAGRLEARAHDLAVSAIMDAASASSEAVSGAGQAHVDLNASLSAATTASAAASAYDDYEAALVGSSSVEGSVLADLVEVDTLTEVSVQTAVDSAIAAAGAFDTTVSAGVDTALSASGAVDPGAVATAVVDAWTTYESAVTALADTTLTGVTNADAGVELMLEATGSFRASGN